MARIPAEEIERIKRETDLAALVQASGVLLRRHGADLLGLCPFHDSTTTASRRSSSPRRRASGTAWESAARAAA
jgi:hypothetical protein